ncbi:MAG: formate dehydrogenase accessory sulfurtransferase FdhD [Myxococcota bacterium]|nr:formate dehydrogenase accessory sulfurtransferase FdhD [Myxococcota bacterium]
MKGVAPRTVLRLGGREGATRAIDRVTVEEPLEIRIAGEPLLTTLRTPGDDHALALGLLHAEGVIRSVADVGTVVHCGRPGDPGWGNVIDVRPGPGVSLDAERIRSARRSTLMTGACGVCGRASIDELLARVDPLPVVAGSVPRERVVEAVERLGESQRGFAATGGSHAAAVWSTDGRLLSTAEDVGRHNAVDKVVGLLLRDGLLPPRPGFASPALLVVSGRVGFEIVQKATVARIGVVAGIGATTTLAIDLAERAGLTLCAFVRHGRCNVHSHPERLA